MLDSCLNNVECGICGYLSTCFRSPRVELRMSVVVAMTVVWKNLYEFLAHTYVHVEWCRLIMMAEEFYDFRLQIWEASHGGNRCSSLNVALCCLSWIQEKVRDLIPRTKLLRSVYVFNSIKWSLSVKHTFSLLYLMYYSGDMFRLSIGSSSGPYIKNTDP
jgi:hypothetical protein